MDATSKIREMQKQMIQLLCSVTIPTGVLPHTVFVEEEDTHGDPTFNKYHLISINQKNKTCILSDEMKKRETYNLIDINIDWLATVLDRCYDLMPRKNLKNPEYGSSKILWAFLYPCIRFKRNAHNNRIIAGYERYNNQKAKVEKLTPDELAEKINDDMFNDQEYFIRFIELPKSE